MKYKRIEVNINRPHSPEYIITGDDICIIRGEEIHFTKNIHVDDSSYREITIGAKPTRWLVVTFEVEVQNEV